MIRDASDRDWPLAKSLYIEAARATHPGSTEQERERHVEQRKTRWLEATLRLLALRDGRPAGLIWLVRDRAEPRGQYVQLVAVERWARRKGLARLLLREAVRRAGGTVRAGIHPDNASSLALFAGEGFVTEAVTPGLIFVRREACGAAGRASA